MDLHDNDSKELTSKHLSSPSVSPLVSKNSLEDSVNPASVHALQTAFGSLQKKHNDLAKKFNELQQRNKLMQRALGDMNYQGNLKQFEGMDEAFVNEPSIAHAAGAGAEGDMDSMRAEYRAKQGYIQHLEKEVLRSNSAIARGNEEIRRLKRKLDDFERERMTALKGKDTMQADFEVLRDALEQSKIENHEKSGELMKLKERLEMENQSRLALVNDNSILREKLEFYEHSANFEKDTEIQDLQSKLTIADNELKVIKGQLRDSETRLQQRDREVSVLEAKCRQFEIHVDIGRKNNQRQGESRDEVDGDIEKLTQAFHMIQEQKDVISQLKSQLSEQQAIISKMSSTKVHKLNEQRTEAPGQSMSHWIEEKPFFENVSNVRSHLHDAALPDMRPQLYERNVQGHGGSARVSPRGGEGMLNSPRVQDVVKPTGNRSVAAMMATGSNQHLKRGVPNSNVTDSAHIDVSRFDHIPVANASANVNRTSPARGNAYHVDLSPQNVSDSCGVPKNNDSGEYYNTSPRTRQDQPIGISQYRDTSPRTRQDQHMQHGNFNGTLVDTGARPRVPSSYLNIQQDDEPSSPPANRIPDRMTKSEIYVNKAQLDSTAMTRSVLEPVRPLLIPSQGSNHDLEASGSPLPRHTTARVREPTEHIYMNEMEGRNANVIHDYENVYKAKDLTEIKHPPTTSDITTPDSRPVPAATVTMNPIQLQHDNVVTLKICPSCNEEFSRLTMDQFQQHVFECFDTCEETQTLHAGGEVNNSEDDRNCPMCGESFPTVIPQETFEQHVLAHFGEEPLIEEERFEVLQP